MSDIIEMEKRVQALEQAVADLQSKATPPTPARNWLEEIAGTFENDPEFAKIVQYGREFRESQPYPDEVEP